MRDSRVPMVYKQKPVEGYMPLQGETVPRRNMVMDRTPDINMLRAGGRVVEPEDCGDKDDTQSTMSKFE